MEKSHFLDEGDNQPGPVKTFNVVLQAKMAQRWLFLLRRVPMWKLAYHRHYRQSLCHYPVEDYGMRLSLLLHT